MGAPNRPLSAASRITSTSPRSSHASALLAEPQFKYLTVFVADYDKESALKKELKVTQQSTFVVFKAGKEVTRSTGQTSKAAIAEVLGKAL